MKNGLLIWNVVLTLVAGFLLFKQFGPSGKNSKVERSVANDTTAVSKKDFRIAYFEMDSVEANFERVKEVKAELNKKEEGVNIEMDRLSRDYQQRLNYYQTLAQTGKMTQEQQEAAGQELKVQQDKITSRKQELEQDYQETSARLLKEVKNTIEDFLKEYNQNRGYSYIFVNEPGLFYYRDSTYNITNDVVRGLNIRYVKKTK